MIDFQNSILFSLIQTTNTFRGILEKTLNEIGLHSGQIFILVSLWQKDGQSQIDLVNNLNLTAPTVNKMTKSLIKGNFVECRKCSTDGRLMRVFLTKKGFDVQNEAVDLWGRVEEQVFSNLTDTERLIMKQILTKLREQSIQNVFKK